MSRRTSTVAVLLSSAALFSGAPATALAHNGHHGGRGEHHGFRHHHGDGLARTAQELGVTKEQLKSALKAVKDQQQAAARPPSFKDLLATKLSVTDDQLKAAYQQARSSGAQSKDAFLAAFASALGTDSAHVTAAMDSARADAKAQWEAKRQAFINALAAQLNVDPAKVDAAFDKGCGFKHH